MEDLVVVVVRLALLLAGLMQPVFCAALCALCATCGLCPPANLTAAPAVAAAPRAIADECGETACGEAAPALGGCGGCCSVVAVREDEGGDAPSRPCCPPASERGPFCVMCPDAGPWSLPERMPELPKSAPQPAFAASFDGRSLAALRNAPPGGGRAAFLFSSASERRTVLCIWLN